MNFMHSLFMVYTEFMHKKEIKMARVHKDFKKQFGVMRADELQDPIIFVVDMIYGFIHEGALHDEAIHTITPHIQGLLKDRKYHNIFVTDTHLPNAREFYSYPVHCLMGSKESKVIEELTPHIQEVMFKNSTNTFTCTAFQLFLKERIQAFKDIIITGCCSDICIMQFALCLNAWLNEHNIDNMRVIIPMNCIDTYHIEGVHDAVLTNEFSIQNMAANGIHIVNEIKRG